MVKKKFKTAIIIGFGSMGIRHFKALKRIKFKVISICEKDTSKVKKYPFLKNIKIVKNYKNLLKENADLVCIASNTQSRFKITKDFITKSKIEKILTENL